MPGISYCTLDGTPLLDYDSHAKKRESDKLVEEIVADVLKECVDKALEFAAADDEIEQLMLEVDVDENSNQQGQSFNESLIVSQFSDYEKAENDIDLAKIKEKSNLGAENNIVQR